ncbi:hypothetical protein HYFRA_00000255 [Hymenoscyphus fraxineus]|uniref:UBC core domain-containing protein n=1 Tax=Hymenoscyphus fraxineus TaxID=746836 RepID=A0A9N9L1T6_9HELO|nr:hypothetical protein HYFRA_00000255 [Hymenoscyphus fraxineus]
MSSPTVPSDVTRKDSIPKPEYGSAIQVIKYEDRLAFEKIPRPERKGSALRIWKEIRRDIIKEEHLDDTVPHISISPIDGDLHNCLVCIEGPQNTPYEGGIFWITLEFPEEYPYEPPVVTFLTSIYHPNINTVTGKIELCMLYNKIYDVFWDGGYDGDKEEEGEEGKGGKLKHDPKMENEGKLFKFSIGEDWAKAFEKMTLNEPSIDGAPIVKERTDTWLPSMTIESLLVEIVSVLGDPRLEIAVESEIAKLYEVAYEEYVCEAISHTKRHATGTRPVTSKRSKEKAVLTDSNAAAETSQTSTDAPSPPRTKAILHLCRKSKQSV